MKTHLIHRIAASCLALLLLFGSTAKEALHAFASHTDTEHHDSDGLSFEAEHHHCGALSAFVSFFESAAQPFVARQFAHRFAAPVVAVVASLLPRLAPAERLRGPPVV